MYCTLKYFQACMNVFVLPNTKEDILKKVCNHAVLGSTMEVNGAPELLCVPHSSEYCIFLCVQQNKDIHAGLEILEGEYR